MKVVSSAGVHFLPGGRFAFLDSSERLKGKVLAVNNEDGMPIFTVDMSEDEWRKFVAEILNRTQDLILR